LHGAECCKLQNLERNIETAAGLSEKGPIGHTLQQLCDHFPKRVLENDVVTNLRKEGCLIDVEKRHKKRGSLMHVDPSWAANAMVGWKDIDGTDGAYWLVTHPRHFDRALAWLKKKRFLDKVLTVRQMQDLQKHLGDKAAWCFKQTPGTLVVIPVGCCHAVTNVGPNMKVACDFIVEGGISFCMISYMHIWKQFKHPITADYMGIAEIAMQKVKPALQAQLQRMEMKPKQKKQKVR